MKTKKGFTLIELLVVIAIIGVLSGIVLVSLGGARQSARDARRQADMRAINSAMELYYNDNGKYVQSATVPTAIEPGLATAPKDPQGASYGWVDNSAAGTNTDQSYCFYATLEKKSATAGIEFYYVSDTKGVREIDAASGPVVTPCN